jgi:4-coumarate--CoA ligase
MRLKVNEIILQIVDDNGIALENNERGEICAKSASKFLGYINEPEKTSEAYDGDWFKTGDIGYFDEDGYIYIVDRKKELLKFMNYQVTPSELETIINSIDGVVSSCVVGVAEENTGNDIIYAFVIPQESRKLTEEVVLNYVNDRVIDQKRLRGGVYFVENLPVGLTGKVDRNKMKKMAAEISLAANEKAEKIDVNSLKVH